MNAEEQYDALLRLWVFRIFEDPAALARLINHRGFRDDDIAKFVGLSDLTDEPFCEFDPEAAREAFIERHRELEAKHPRLQMPPLIRRNFEQLGTLLQLNGETQRVLEFIAVCQTESAFEDSFNVLARVNGPEFARLAARSLRLPKSRVLGILGAQGELIQSGLINLRENFRQSKRFPGFFSSKIAESLLTEAFDPNKLLREVVIAEPSPTLTFRDYPHLREELKILRPYLRRILKSRQSGVNIFIHGMPGSGKSELARVLARDLRARLFAVTSEDLDGDLINPTHRLNALRMANSLLKKRSILVFDEAEDVFNDGSVFRPSTAQGRKAWVNRMLEHNPVPTIWISNSLAGLDSANARRFDLVFEIGNPPERQRQRSYRRIAKGIASASTLHRMAKVESLAPAVVARATKVVQTLSGDLDAEERDAVLIRLIGNTLKAQGVSVALEPVPAMISGDAFQLDFLHCEADLLTIRHRLAETPSCRICLHGPPGTGKTSFAHWIARELQRPLLSRHASDLLSPYLGGTERNLAAAFHEARESHSVLLLDEVDSFLQDRRQATRSWEVSQVNEFLTQLESFPGLLFASTNLMGSLDQASLRRFDLKLFFDYLQAPQAVAFFSRECHRLRLGRPQSGELRRLESLTHLTPGDFANVSRQHRFRPFDSPASYLEALNRECGFKPSARRAPLGFG